MSSMLRSTANCFQPLMLTVSTVLAFASATSAAVVTQWTFQTSQPTATNSTTIGPLAAEVGIGSASGFHASGSTDYASPDGPASTDSFSSNTWSVGDYYQFMASSIGFSEIVVSFDAMGSNTGPRNFKIAWSTDDSTYTDFDDYSLVNAVWTASASFVNPATAHFEFDFSAITALNNASDIYFRLINTGTTAIDSASPVAATGTSRVDNFTVSGTEIPLTVVPEASALLVWSIICGGMLVGWKRCR